MSCFAAHAKSGDPRACIIQAIDRGRKTGTAQLTMQSAIPAMLQSPHNLHGSFSRKPTEGQRLTSALHFAQLLSHWCQADRDKPGLRPIVINHHLYYDYISKNINDAEHEGARPI